MMTDEDLEKLSLYVDNALPADEAAAVAARITADAEWATAYRTMRRSGEMMRAHADATVAAVDAEALFARVNAELDRRAAGAARAAAVHAESERPGLLRWLSTLLSPPVMLGMAGVAAATAFFVLRQSAPETPPEGKSALVGLTPPAPVTQVAQKPTDPATGPAETIVAVEGVESEGVKTVLVSQPADDGTTVIWLLDEADAGAGSAGAQDDPI